jgi:hypothetical protein
MVKGFRGKFSWNKKMIRGIKANFLLGIFQQKNQGVEASFFKKMTRRNQGEILIEIFPTKRSWKTKLNFLM